MVTINGKEKAGYEGMSLPEVLEKEEYQIDRIAVEHNGEIIPRAKLGDVKLAEGDVLEVVSFVGGGAC